MLVLVFVISSQVIIIIIIIIIYLLEKLEKYQLLKDEIAKVWRMRTSHCSVVVIAALGTVSASFKEYMKRIGLNVRLEISRKQHFWGQKRF